MIEQTIKDILSAGRDHSGYTRGPSVFSVTQLLGPTTISYLRARHEIDPSPEVESRLVENNFFAMMGTAVHFVIENGVKQLGIEGAMIEERLFTEVAVDNPDGTVEEISVSGSPDLILDGWIIDWKFASTWEVLNGVKPERDKQLNLLAAIARRQGIEVKGVAICYIFRDWSAAKARYDRSYPQDQRYVSIRPMADEREADDYLHERAQAHWIARLKGLAGVPQDGHCSKEDRWAKDDVYAVRKVDSKRAVKLYDNERDAKEHADESKGYWVEHRPGESVRCESYCAFKSSCIFGAQL